MAVGSATLAVNDRAGLDQVIGRSEGSGAEQARLAARANAAKVASNDSADAGPAERSSASKSDTAKVSRKAVDAASSVSDTLQKVRSTLETLARRDLSATKRAELSDELRQLSGQVAKFVDGAKSGPSADGEKAADAAAGGGAATGAAASDGGGASGAAASGGGTGPSTGGDGSGSTAGGASGGDTAGAAGTATTQDPLAAVAKTVASVGSDGTKAKGSADGRVASILAVGGTGANARSQSILGTGEGGGSAGGTTTGDDAKAADGAGRPVEGGTAAPGRVSGGGARVGLGDKVPGVAITTASTPRAGLGDSAPVAIQTEQVAKRTALGDDGQRNLSAQPAAGPAPAPAPPAAPTTEAAREPDAAAPPVAEVPTREEPVATATVEPERPPAADTDLSKRPEVAPEAATTAPTPNGGGPGGGGEDPEEDPRTPKRRSIAVQGAIVSASSPSSAPAGSVASVQDGAPVPVTTGAKRATENAFFGDPLLPADVGSRRNDPPVEPPREPPVAPQSPVVTAPPGEVTGRPANPPAPVNDVRPAPAALAPPGETGRAAAPAAVGGQSVRPPEGETSFGRPSALGGSGPISADQASSALAPGSTLDRLSTAVARRLGAIAADQGADAGPASVAAPSGSALGQGITGVNAGRETTAGANDNPQTDAGIAARTAAVRRRGGIVNLFA